MKQPEDRYFLIKEADGSFLICDRHGIEAARDHRVVTGLGQDQAAELIKKLNSGPGESAK